MRRAAAGRVNKERDRSEPNKLWPPPSRCGFSTNRSGKSIASRTTESAEGREDKDEDEEKEAPEEKKREEEDDDDDAKEEEGKRPL